MRRFSRRLVQITAASTLVAASAGCTERPELPPAPKMVPGSVLRSSTGIELVLDCPLRPNIARRAVEPHTSADLNGNGIVCDQRLGPADASRIITIDDLLMPRSAQPSTTPGN